jgi:hypothetical protein
MNIGDPAPLSAKMTALLRRTVEQNEPSLLPLVASVGETPLTEADREALRSVILSEFLRCGVDENNEPTAFGLSLEALIDALARC